MVNKREIRIRVTMDQLERIKMNARAKGFSSIATYMRFLCLEHSKFIEDKIVDNNKMLQKLLDDDKNDSGFKVRFG